MSENINQKVLVSIETNLDEARQSMVNLAGDVKKTADELKNLKAQTAASQAVVNSYNEKIAQSKLTTQQNREEITRLNLVRRQEADAVRKSKDAIDTAKGSYAEAQQKLTALGKAIKNTENGFNSSNPAIQKQIEEYNKLNGELKKFDAKLGNFQRNVGNYGGALEGITEHLGNIVPGFREAHSALQLAAKGFNAMGTGADEAAGEMAGLEGVSAGLAGGLAAIAAVGAGVIAYFKDVAPVSDWLSNKWAGLKASWVELINNIRDHPFTGDAAEDMDKAAEKAEILNQAFLDLNRAMLASEVESNKENQFIATQMLKMRNLHTTAEEAEKIFEQIQETADTQYKRTSKEAEEGYNITANQIVLSAKLTRDETRELFKNGIESIRKFQAEGKHISDDLIEQLVKFQNMRINAEAIKDQITQRAQNREDQKQAKADKEAERAERERIKAENDLIEAKRAGEEIINERKAAIAKMLQDEMDGFAKELSMNDEQYRQKLFKLQDFIKKQEQLRNKTKSPKAKAQYTKNITAANALIGTDKEVHAADQEKLTTDYFKKQAELIQKGEDELKNIEISSIKDVTKRELAALDQQHEVQLQAYTKEQNLLSDDINKTRNSLKKAKGEEKQALQDHLNQLLDLQGVNQDKSLALTRKYEDDRIEIIKQSQDREMELRDRANVVQAAREDKDNSGKHDKALLDAEQKALLDKYNAEVSQKGLTDAQMLLMEQEYLTRRDELNDQYRAKEFDKAVKWEELVQNAATTIIQNAINSQYEYTIANLNRQKTFELNNKALTSTQKVLLDEKYRKLEGQAKVKEFKQNQKLQVANALINLMVGEGKLWVDPGFPAAIPLAAMLAAQSAVQIATIMAQKPPAYATGGIHKSDGRGGVLPGYSKTDNINAHLRSGEGIIVSEAMQNPVARSIASNINQAFGGRAFDGTPQASKWIIPGFAAGGIMSNSYLPTVDNGLRPNSSGVGRMHPDDLSTLGNIMANAVSMMPAPIVDVKDVAYEQNKISSVVDRANY